MLSVVVLIGVSACFADFRRTCASLMEDQAVEVVGQIGKRGFCLRTGNADGSDEEAVAVLLMRKDLFDVSADC